jgi:hypothetical protein
MAVSYWRGVYRAHAWHGGVDAGVVLLDEPPAAVVTRADRETRMRAATALLVVWAAETFHAVRRALRDWLAGT